MFWFDNISRGPHFADGIYFMKLIMYLCQNYVGVIINIMVKAVQLIHQKEFEYVDRKWMYSWWLFIIMNQ